MMLDESISLVLKRRIRSSSEENECLPSAADFERYNLTLRIISIFVLLVISLIGSSVAVISTRVKRLRIPLVIINVGKFFGTG